MNDITVAPAVAVLGAGSFGTALANVLAENGHAVALWMRSEEQAKAMCECRRNPRHLKDIPLHEAVQPTADMAQALGKAPLVFVALPSTALRSALLPAAKQLDSKILVSTTKGIETTSFKRMSEILEQVAPQARIGVLSGPNLAHEIAEHALTATVVASRDAEVCRAVQGVLHGRTLRVYASDDLPGVELGGALKNVYAIMAGMAEAMGMGENTRSMLITRALAEMTRFAVSHGAQAMTFLGLAGVGDLVVTCSSPKSRNYRVGYSLGQGVYLEEATQSLGEVAEGVNTLRALKARSDEQGIYMPLVQGLYAILFQGYSLPQIIEKLMTSDPKTDIDLMQSSGLV